MKESEKLNVQKAKIMALEGMAIRRGKVEVMTDFHFLGSKTTVDGDCSYEIRR